MSSPNRKRALDDIRDQKDDWVEFNRLFKEFIPQFDESFDRGVPANLDHYVCRKGSHPEVTFEEEMCDNFFSTHINPTGKVYVINGKVGSGKTCFVRYIAERLLKKRNEKAFAVYLDTCNLPKTYDNYMLCLEDLLKDAVELSVISGKDSLFPNQKEFYFAGLSSLGYTSLSDQYLLENGRKQFRIPDILKFLLEHPQIERLLIALDNIDENSQEAVICGRDFAEALGSKAWQIIQELARKGLNKACCVLIPVRNYTATFFFDTKRFAMKDLPYVSEADVLREKLKQSKQSICSVAQEVSVEVPVTFYDRKQKVMSSKTVIITRSTAAKFVIALSDELFSKEHDFTSFLRDISAHNLKILVNNCYYFIHSNKLPYLKLFRKMLAPSSSLESKDDENLVPFHVAIECLLAIHYPFYDVEKSLIMNIFNLDSSSAPNNYQNTLLIPRLLCLLINTAGISFAALKDRLGTAGYSDLMIEKALKKSIHYGLIDSSHGIRLTDFTEQTLVGPSSAASVYIKELIQTPSYLQYVCEDTPMPDRFVVTIIDKYNPGSQRKRFESVEKLIAFIKEEENLEKEEVIGRRKFNEESYLGEFSVQVKYKPVWLHQMMTSRAIPTLRGMAEH